MGYRAGCEKNARAFYLKRKCICDKTQVRFTSNARAFDSKRKGVFGEFRKGKHDGLSGLAGIFIKCIYAGCGKIQRLYFSTPVYREFAKPVPTPTTRQAFRCRFMLLCWFNVCKSGKYGFSSILPYYCLKSLFEGIFTHFFVLVLHLFAYLCEKTHLRFDSNALVF